MSGSARTLLVPGVGWAFGCSRPGAAHRREGRPCQDAFLLTAGAAVGVPYLSAAVADGHGNAAHDLSQYGADLAVRVAAEEWHALLGDFLPDTATLLSDFRAGFAARLARRWRDRVHDDARRRGHFEHGVHRRYGTTLLTALALPGLLLLARIGDGDILLLGPTGLVDRPLPAPERLGGGETYSLAGADVPLYLDTAVRERAAGVLLLCTDGLDHCFAPGGLDLFASTVADRVRTAGAAVVAAAQPAWLDHFSACGGGDDVTLVAVGLDEPTRSPAARA